MSFRSDHGASKKKTNNLVALGSAAVLGVYAAGYAHTAAAAARFGGEVTERRAAVSIARSGVEAPTATSAAAAVNEPPAIAPSSPTSDTVTGARVSAAPAQQKPSAPTKPAATTKTVDSATTRNGAARAMPASADPEVIKDPKPAVVAGTAVAAATVSVPAPVAPVAPGAPVSPARADSAQVKTAIAAADSAAKEADKKRLGLKDGTYVGYGTSRHGDIEATVEVSGGKIISASISQCRTQYSCSWIAALPPQVITRQSAEVDYVSGATQSSNAFYSAVVEALKQAK